MSTLAFLVYVSSSVELLDGPALVELLRGCRENNARLGVTGLLLYHEGNFIQVLEGEPGVVEALYAHIERDRRHRGCLILLRGPIERRIFPDWSMGFRNVAQVPEAERAAVDDFLRESRAAPSGADARKVWTLLAAFKATLR